MKRVFISFKMEDKKQVDGVRLMAWNSKFDLEFYDESVRWAYNSENAAYIRSKIKPKIQRASVALCLVGQKTWMSDWVNWEMNTAIDMKKNIFVMALPGVTSVTLPTSVRGHTCYLWSPNYLASELERLA